MVIDTASRYPGTAQLVDDIRRAIRDATFVDARHASEALFGDDQYANLLLIGIACQRGALPLPASAIEQAIALNGVRIEENVQAFRRGRQYVADRDAFDTAMPAATATASPAPGNASVIADLVASIGCPTDSQLAALAHRRVGELIAFQSARYAARYADFVACVYRAEQQAALGSVQLTTSVARNLHKLMAYKDEYEVARLSLLPEAADVARARFGPSARMSYRLHPTILRTLGLRRKITLGPWFRAVFAALVLGRRLRGTPLDPFGYTRVRRIERGLVSEYREIAETLIRDLSSDNVALAAQIADLPDLIRGYEGVKLANVDRYHAQTAELLARYTLTAAGTDDLSPTGER
jgi:indolepyruvate ferredoxin oxidoreductase